MGSYKVICHLTQMNTPRLNPSRKGYKAELTYVTSYILRWVTRPSIQLLTRQHIAGSQIRMLLITSLTPEPLNYQTTMIRITPSRPDRLTAAEPSIWNSLTA